jgi:DNA-binding response OmpR family regulator
VRVLVVEDSRALSDVVVEGLRDEGMAVDVAYDGLQAATKLDLNTYDVVVLDRDLPRVHGDTICRMITERENPAMVLMLTASGTPAQRVSGLRLGADDYLPKPFHFPELVLRIRALARRRPTAQARIFRSAGIELDPIRHTATRDGRRLELSAKEFAVLEALMRAQRAVLSAEDLFARCGTRTSTRSQKPSTSRSADCDTNSENPQQSKPSPTWDTASQNPREPSGSSTSSSRGACAGTAFPDFPDPSLSIPPRGEAQGIIRGGMYWPLPAGTVQSPAFEKAATICGLHPPAAEASA